MKRGLSVALLAGVGVLALALPAEGQRVVAPLRALEQAAFRTAAPSATSSGQMTLVLAATERYLAGPNHGYQQIFTAAADGTGSGLHQLTTYDGTYYDWPSWAMNNTKIVFTSKQRLPQPPHDNVGEETISLMSPDGGDRLRITTNPWRNLQPHITPDGGSMIFSSYAPEFPVLGIYRMDLPTTQVTNLSSVTRDGGLDADPSLSSDGKQIVFASAFTDGGAIPTQVFAMNADGSNRRRISHDNWFDTDPSISPDGHYVVWSSYRGKDRPELHGPNEGFVFPMADWYIVIHDLTSGSERLLTNGQGCAFQALTLPACTPAQASAWVPRWSPDGTEVGFLASLSPIKNGVYAMRPDGTGARTVFESPNLSPSYWDWAVPGPSAPTGAVESIGRSIPRDQLLITGSSTSADGRGAIMVSGPDRWNAVAIRLERSDLVPSLARWSPDKRQIVFTARVPFDPQQVVFGPAPPAGETRHEHFTLDQLGRVMVNPSESTSGAAEQVFLMNSDGTHVRQLTTPGTEDYMDAIRSGDLRGNTDPSFSPDGRYVVFTSRSTLSAESFILRLDLQGGSVLNLSNRTAGAVPVADAKPRYSPDGRRIAFQSMIGANSAVLVMDPDGSHVTTLVDDQQYNVAPAWSPDGRRLAYSSYQGQGFPFGDDGSVRTDAWALRTVDVATRGVTQLTSLGESPAFEATWSPDGSALTYISASAGNQADLYRIGSVGGSRSRVSMTFITREESIDWR